MITSHHINESLVAINDYESASEVANLLIKKTRELEDNKLYGRPSGYVLQQLKSIVHSVYHSTDDEYKAILHNVVSYVLLKIFNHE